MQDTKSVESMVPNECRPEAEEVARFIDELDQNGKERFLEFIRGAKFALGLRNQKQAV